MKWLPERGDAPDNGKVFDGLIAEPNINKVLAKWVKAAGITKKITYHAGRHSFVTTFGMRKGKHSNIVHSEVKMDDLFNS